MSTFQGKQLSSCFNIKDKTKFPHKHDLVLPRSVNVLKKDAMITMLAKRQDASLKVCQISVKKIKILIF